jgi:hypothetical protein
VRQPTGERGIDELPQPAGKEARLELRIRQGSRGRGPLRYDQPQARSPDGFDRVTKATT